MRLLYRLNTLNLGEILDPQGRGGWCLTHTDWPFITPTEPLQSYKSKEKPIRGDILLDAEQVFTTLLCIFKLCKCAHF